VIELLLLDDDTTVDTEATLFMAVMLWVVHLPPNPPRECVDLVRPRVRYLNQLLHCIRFFMLDGVFALDVVTQCICNKYKVFRMEDTQIVTHLNRLRLAVEYKLDCQRFYTLNRHTSEEFRESSLIQRHSKDSHGVSITSTTLDVSTTLKPNGVIPIGHFTVGGYDFCMELVWTPFTSGSISKNRLMAKLTLSNTFRTLIGDRYYLVLDYTVTINCSSPKKKSRDT